MALLPISLPPGVNNNGTQYQVKGRWYNASQVRWVDGVMQPIGGWASIATGIAHPVRGMFTWETNNGVAWCALGTSSQLLISQGAGTLSDVTPAGMIAGSDDAFQMLGYGGVPYGTGNYGQPNPAGAAYLPPTTWQFDAWGEDLVACASTDGRIYQWNLTVGTPAAVVANAPINNAGIVVTEQQHLMALGAAGNPKLVQWSDQENNTVWTPGTTNEAGQIPLVTNGAIVCGLNVNGVVLVLTTTDAHSMQYLGQPLIFNRTRVGDKCGVISAKAAVVAGNAGWWMSDKRFWMFNGSAAQEVPCEVANYVFQRINQNQVGKIYAATQGKYGEVTWFYPSGGSNENDSYVTYNYLQQFWQIGSLARTSFADSDAFPFPLATDAAGNLYQHETGTLANGASRVSAVFAQTSALETGSGTFITDINQVVVDEKTLGDTQLTFSAAFTPNGTRYNYGPYQARPDGYMDVQVTGRQIVMTVTPTIDNAWQLGTMRWDVQPGSER